MRINRLLLRSPSESIALERILYVWQASKRKRTLPANDHETLPCVSLAHLHPSDLLVNGETRVCFDFFFLSCFRFYKYSRLGMHAYV
jgi:hypothetical protein